MAAQAFDAIHVDEDIHPMDVHPMECTGAAQTFLIRHHYDIGDQGVTIQAPQGFDARRAAIYMQFWAENWFGDHKILSNLGVAAALVTFYGCKHAARSPVSNIIDMHLDREAACGPDSAVLIADDGLKRDGLRDLLAPHLEG